MRVMLSHLFPFPSVVERQICLQQIVISQIPLLQRNLAKISVVNFSLQLGKCVHVLPNYLLNYLIISV